MIILFIALLVMFQILLPTFIKISIGAREYMFRCSRCGKLLSYNEAIVVPDESYPIYDKYLERTYLPNYTGLIIAMLLGIILVIVTYLVALSTMETTIIGIVATIIGVVIGVLSAFLMLPIKRKIPEKVLEITVKGKFGGIITERFKLLGYGYVVYCIDCLKKYRKQIHSRLSDIAKNYGEVELQGLLEELRKKFFANVSRGVFWIKKKPIKYIDNIHRRIRKAYR